MLYYTRIPFWINKSRLSFLKDFRDDLERYFDNSRFEWMADARIEEPEARNARVIINRNMDEAYRIILSSGVNPTLRYTPPAAIGGYIQDINVINNIFNLDNYSIPTEHLFDFIDRSIGIYEKNHFRSLVRTINPFFWISEIISFISSLPFKLIGYIGFDQQRAERSILGRILKGILYFFTLLASVLTVLQLLDLLEPFKSFVRNIFNI